MDISYMAFCHATTVQTRKACGLLLPTYSRTIEIHIKSIGQSHAALLPHVPSYSKHDINTYGTMHHPIKTGSHCS